MTGPHPDLLSRSVLLWDADHPALAWFDEAMPWVLCVGAIVEIAVLLVTA